MKKSFVRITTYDTKKTYELPGENVPKLWEVKLSLFPVYKNGHTKSLRNYEDIHINPIYIELETILKAGLKPYSYKPKEDDPKQIETPEELLIRLLESVGYYPQQ